MAEFIVNEKGVDNLIGLMESRLQEIQRLTGDIGSSVALLRSALGEDAGTIEQRIHTVEQELQSAQGEMNIITADMRQYIAKVKQVRVTLEQ